MYWTPPISGPYAGVSVYYDRESTAEFAVTGNTDSVFEGSIYMKSGELSFERKGRCHHGDGLAGAGRQPEQGRRLGPGNHTETLTPPGFGGCDGNRRLVG